MSGWWMMMPWMVKKYMDDVYTLRHGHLYANDGRTRQNPSKQYGTGGLLHGKSICFQWIGMPLSMHLMNLIIFLTVEV
ncbi:NAD(P)H-dependent oxidoreductase [Providencia rettgeri]|nr:NAD(P)H-dependent oxidoreductase [Providencia rettgeri]